MTKKVNKKNKNSSDLVFGRMPQTKTAYASFKLNINNYISYLLTLKSENLFYDKARWSREDGK